MNTRNIIQNELREMNSSLPYESEKPVFDLPEGYFENFAASVLTKIRSNPEVSAYGELQELSSSLAGIDRKMPFTVPEGYFSSLTNSLPGLIKEDPVLPELQQIGKKLPYAVPDDYFTTLPATILNKVRQPKAKILSLGTSSWMRYAPAAVIAGVIALSSIVYLNTNSSRNIDLAKQPGAWVANKLEDVSNKDLEEFINTTDVSPKTKHLAQTSVKHMEVRKLLNDVPDAELDDFLSAVPTDNDEISMN